MDAPGLDFETWEAEMPKCKFMRSETSVLSQYFVQQMLCHLERSLAGFWPNGVEKSAVVLQRISDSPHLRIVESTFRRVGKLAFLLEISQVLEKEKIIVGN